MLCRGLFRKVQVLFKKSGHPIFVGPRLKNICNRCILQSVIQVREILFDILQLDKKCSRSLHLTQKQREKSTSEQVLESLKTIHPLPGLILQPRKLSKLLSFLQSLLPLISEPHNRLYPCWQQTGAATGRLSCNTPNLQVK